MASFLFLATAGAGGDLQPLVAAALGLHDRGHRMRFLGDPSVERALRGLDLEVDVLPQALDLGPRLIGAIREAMTATAGDEVAAGPLVQRHMSGWAREVAGSTRDVVLAHRPDAIVTSLFGVEVLESLSPDRPRAVVNSTFAVWPDRPRPLEKDFGPRALPLIARYAELLETADLVLHATDPAFDFGGQDLPARHHYVGPLGIWEPENEVSCSGLDEPGAPWLLVTLSSQLQEDVALADAALAALADRPVRVLLTLGPGHDRSELSVLPANVRVESVVSHSAVLERAILLLSHAGHGSVMKALWHGRPMVLVPWGRDQPGVAARAEALGVAVIVPRGSVSSETLAGAVDAALGDAEMQDRAARQGARLRVTDPPGAAASLLETLP
jgi:UDP:flavonoid glycosyltransferase YjiC (YdhE family)